VAYAQSLFDSWDESGVPNAKDLAVHDVMARRKFAERDAEVKELAGPELEEGLSREMDIALTEMAPAITADMVMTYDDALAKGLLVEVGMDPQSHPVDWQSLIPVDTPLYRMFKAACVTDIPDEFVVWSIYTALGSLIGRRVELIDSVKPVDPAFWTVLSGSTGTQKSTIATQMDKILSHVAPPSGSEGAKIIGTPASGERFMEMIRRDEVTGIGVTTEVEECKNSASFMFVDEFSLLAGMMARAGNSLSSHMLMSYGCGRDQMLRPSEAMGRISFPVTGPMLSILSTTQPNRISTMLDRYDVASGFMNRFTFIHGAPRRVCTPMMGFGPDWSAVQDEFQMIQNRLNCADVFIPMHDKAFVDKPWQLTPDSGGLIRLREWIIEQNDIMSGSDIDSMTVDMLARRDLIMKKLVLIMAINRIVGAGTTKVGKNWTEADVEAAIGHWDNLRWGWLSAAERIYSTEDSELESWVLETLGRKGAEYGMAQNELRGLIPKSKRIPAKDFNTMISALAASGAFRQVDLRKPKTKKSTKWLYPNDMADVPLPEGYEVE
jgi:hypothetical protein